MPPELSVVVDVAIRFGLPLAFTIALGWLILRPRKDRDGNPLAPYLVAGAELDAARASIAQELRAVRSAASEHVSEWKRLRDEERTARLEADARLVVAIALIAENTRVTQEARLELARSSGIPTPRPKPKPPGRST